MLPSIFGESFGESFFDDFMNFPFERNTKKMAYLLKTDIKETDDGYELTIELPGYRKEDINAQLSDGYLSISANREESKDEKDKKGRYIRRERYEGSISRSYHVGKSIQQKDMKARFENGVLHLTFPKETPEKLDETEYIQIEG